MASLWQKASNAFHKAYQGWTSPKVAGRTTNLWNTKSTFTSVGNRKDKEVQEAFRNDIAEGKKVRVNRVQSSRWQYGKSNTLYDANDVAEKDFSSYSFKEDGEPDEKITERSVESTAIDSFEYDPNSKTLTIYFQGNSTGYDYPNVPAEVVTEMMEAPSKGRYVNTVIAPKYSVGIRGKGNNSK